MDRQLSDGSSCSTQSFYDDNYQESAYVYIRTLGKGAFGEAVLYRKVADDSLVVWKGIDLQRLSEKERRDSQNEIEILSILNHANIVSYYNHFMDGETLLIEMEYANGGNLAEKIASQEKLFAEEVVMWYFYQVAAAVAHIHEYGILHRDIKTLNIFLTKSGLIKLGDFGISRIMESQTQMAESYVGTPYYMSPELIQGEPYNQKSDIWSTGCVLYELLSLTKVFDATNPLKLAWEIVQNSFEDIDPSYSGDIRNLLHDVLNKDPSKRPTSEEILKYPVMLKVADEMNRKVWELNSATRKAKMSVTANTSEMHPVVTSKSSELYFWGGGKLTPQKFDVFTRGRSALQVSTGQTHFAVVTVEKELYTWATSQGGTEMVGQLGHGDTAAYKAPRKLSTLEGTPVKQAACGEDFTVIVTDEGAVYSFGSDYYGCLGCDNEEGDSVCTPVLVEFFNDKPVEQVSCGDAHVIALTKDGDVYTWGCGEYGRLGLGSEDDFALPQKVLIRGGKHGIRSVHAGPDGSFVIKTNGRVLACGSNEDNKLGFNSSARGLRKHKEISYDIPCKLTFTTVKPLSKYHIIAVSAGTTHSAAIDLYGHLMVFGSNKYGQLGVGDFKERHGVNLITGALSGKRVVKVACGDGFTVISTSENQIYSWGQSENGRLGSLSSGEGRGPNGSCFALPRTMFGSLHVVSDVSSRYWNTILVAEKVLTQKTIRSTSVRQMKSGAPLVDCGLSDDEFHEDCSSTASGARPKSADAAGRRGAGGMGGDSTAPAWLKLELQEAEFIPVDSPGLSTADTSMEDSAVPDWLQQEICDAVDPSQSPGVVDIPPLPITSTPQDTSPDEPPQPIASTPNDPAAPSYDLVDATVERDHLQAVIRQLQEENTRIREDFDKLVMENSTMKAENSNLKSQNEQLQALAGDANKASAENVTTNPNQAQEVAALSEENARLKEENQKYSTEISSLSKKVLKLTEEVTMLENSKAIVEEQNAKLSYDVHELRKGQIKEK